MVDTVGETEETDDEDSIKTFETSTGRLVIYNSKDARERISSQITIEVEP